jgi:CO/xanthine dehydrogenase FAD-binding subunit
VIPFNFVYMRPRSVEEAAAAFQEADRAGRQPVYYAGGSEIISFCRQGKIRPGVLIDIKSIPECRVDEERGGHIRLGAALTLNELIEADRFQLLSRAASGISDHTLRNRITLGGNIAGMLPYREALLPLILAGATAECAGFEGRRAVALAELFDRRLKLSRGEFLIALELDKQSAAGKWFYRRRERGTANDYPLVTACFLVHEGEIRMALSGAASHPFRDGEVDALLNRISLAPEAKAEAVLEAIGDRLREDFRASAAYRRHLLKRILTEALTELGGRS